MPKRGVWEVEERKREVGKRERGGEGKRGRMGERERVKLWITSNPSGMTNDSLPSMSYLF